MCKTLELTPVITPLPHQLILTVQRFRMTHLSKSLRVLMCLLKM